MTTPPSPRPVRFTDEGFRDAPQSLWGSRMSTQAMVDIAGRVDAAGYPTSNIISGATFESAVQNLHEDPWLRIDSMVALMPRTRPAAQIRGRTLFGWQQYPDDVVRLFVDVLARHGIRSLLVYEALNDMRMIEQIIAAGRDHGLEISIPVCYSVSPVHTDEYFAATFRRAAAMKADRVSILDASGLLSPTAAGVVAAAARTALADTGAALEMNVHDLTGRALDCYRAGLEAGVEVFATAPRAVSYGRSIPAIGDLIGLVEEAGHSHDLDVAQLAEIEAYYRWAGLLQGEAAPTSVRLDDDEIATFTTHQIPGGMMSNLVRQLTDLGIEDRLPEILVEVQRVRAELGYPVMVTPCSQMVGVQATLNVLANERYASSPVEMRNYLRGVYGTPPGDVDPNVRDRVLGDEAGVDPYERLAEPMLPRFRAEHGPFRSDEDLLLAILYSESALAELRRRGTPTEIVRPRKPQTAFVAAVLDRVRPTRLTARL